MTVYSLADPVALPCGAVVSNRIVKAALTEGLSGGDNQANARFERLYRRWGEGGVGMMITGNVLVDRWHLERPNNIVIDDGGGRRQLAALARAGTARGAHFWAQLSHTGRQVSSHINPAPLSCSDVEIDVIRSAGFSFARPRPMTSEVFQW